MKKLRTHKHDLKDLERTIQLLIDGACNVYDFWCCFDRDCDYFELRLSCVECKK